MWRHFVKNRELTSTISLKKDPANPRHIETDEEWRYKDLANTFRLFF